MLQTTTALDLVPTVFFYPPSASLVVPMTSDKEHKTEADPELAGVGNTTQNTAHSIHVGGSSEVETSMQQQLQRMQNSMEQFMRQMMEQQQMM